MGDFLKYSDENGLLDDESFYKFLNEKTLKERGSLESLGNKALLEKSINIRASDYKFEDKKKYYQGFINDFSFECFIIFER